MPQNDRHKEREIPIEFDFYNTLESLPVDNRCTIIMISCGSTTVKINEHIQTVTAPAVLCISQYDNFQCLERTHLSAKVSINLMIFLFAHFNRKCNSIQKSDSLLVFSV